MNDYTYKVVSDEVKNDDDVVMIINDWYDNSDTCNYATPVSESPSLPYTIVKEDKSSDKDTYYDVSYAL